MIPHVHVIMEVHCDSRSPTTIAHQKVCFLNLTFAVET